MWTGVARHWYTLASNIQPTTGRLYHHLAILARPLILPQLFLYSKSLCTAIPFTWARHSILTLFEPILNSDNRQYQPPRDTTFGQVQYRPPSLDTAFVKAHGLLFTNKDLHKFDSTMVEFLSLLNTQIGVVTRKFMEQGYHIAIVNSSAMLDFGFKGNVLMKAIQKDEDDFVMANSALKTRDRLFKNARRLSNTTAGIVLERVGDPNVLPFIHVTLVFLLFVTRNGLSKHFEEFPWKSLARILNTIISSISGGYVDPVTFPKADGPLPEEYAIHGLLWCEGHFPQDHFQKPVDPEEQYHERASMTAERKLRLLWAACRIAGNCEHMRYSGGWFLTED